VAQALFGSAAEAGVICVKKNRALVFRDVACGVKEARLDPEQYDLRGPQGPQGLPGPPGEPGSPATAWWGYVNVDGSRGYGSGITATARTGVGNYLVTFDRPVQNCGYVATLAGDPGEIWTYPSDAGAAAIVVSTRRSNGSAQNSGFWVAMFCP
jgi:hypothetical protein